MIAPLNSAAAGPPHLSGPLAPKPGKYTLFADNPRIGTAAVEPFEGAVQPATVVRGELLVRFKSNVARARQQSVLAPWAKNVRFMRPPNQNRALMQKNVGGAGSVFEGLALVQLDSKTDLRQALDHFRKHPDVLYAEPNYRLQVAGATPSPVLPDDFDFAQLWGMQNVGQAEGTQGADIHAAQAWEYATGDKRIVVAVVDTGIDFYHPDLADNIWKNPNEVVGDGIDDDGNGYPDDIHGYDFVSDDGDPLDDLGHGTHVAGTIGAVGNNQAGVVGVCWKVSLMAVKVFDETGNGDVERAIEGIRYAVENGARVINASWGSYDKSRALEEVINEVHQAGVVFIAAAGNDNSANPFYPAAYNHVISVAATNAKDQRARFSNYAPYVTVSAPGENIYSTVPNGGYEFYSGTSMATPHVSGVAALILSRHPEFDDEAIANIIRNSVDRVKSEQPIGTGRINAALAVRVDMPLPKVHLQLPGTLYGNVDIPGTATGSGFAQYVLEYGSGTDPTNWTAFYRSPTPVSSGTLFQDFSTPLLAEGPCTFRLTAENATGERAVERAVVQISNVHIRFPTDNDVLRAGDQLQILGTVVGGNRTFTLQYGAGTDPASWSDAGMALTAGGRTTVTNGVLAVWDTSAVPPNQFYTLKLTAKADDQAVNEYRTRLVYLDNHLKPGWPRYLPVEGEFPTEDWRDFKVADVDKDGTDEIILVDHGNNDGKPARLLVYREDGSLYWAKELASGYPYSDVPTVGDLEGDGFLEIFVDVGSDGQLFAFRFDGSPVPGKWPVHLESTSLGKTLADIDGDGRKELIGYSNDPVNRGGVDYRQIVVYDAAGNLLQKWEVPGCDAESDSPRIFPAVADLDGDSELEIVVISGCDLVSAYKLSEPAAPIWTASTYGTLISSPVVGDLDHDGTNEVVVAAYDRNNLKRGGVYVINHNGKRRPGWPVLLDESFPVSPSLGDLDGDGRLEISVPCKKSGFLHLVRLDGFEASGWPVGPVNSSSFRSSSIIGDVDGDGRLDVVLAAPGYMSLVVSAGDNSQAGGIKAWNGKGKQISLSGNPALPSLVMESSVGAFLRAAPPVLADVDHNGKLDVVGISVQDRTYLPLGEKSNWKKRSSIYVWELDAPYKPELLPWPAFQANAQHTGWYPAPRHQNEPPVLSTIPNQVIRSGTMFFPIELDQYVEDPDNSAKQITWNVTGNQQLIVQISSNRVVTVVVPSAAWAGSETLRFVARDPGGLSSEASATFEARPDYVAPAAGNDRVTTPEDTPIEIDVLANDSDPNHNPLSIASLSKPRLGKVVKTDKGTLLYTPKQDANGTESFSYIVTDGKGGMSFASVSVEITPLNDPPSAGLDRVITDEDIAVEIHVLDNDTDPDGDTLSVTEFTQPAHGSVLSAPGSALLYTPNTNYSGPDAFTYMVADPYGATNEGTVNLLVEPVNDPPVAKEQSFTLNRNSSQDITFDAADPDDTEFTFTVVDTPLHGTLWNYPKVATYYPTNGFVGDDSFTYRANDGKADGPLSTIHLRVVNANNAPKAEDQSVVTKVGQSVSIVLGASDLDNDPLRFEIVEQPANGTLTGSGTNYVYEPNPSFLGKDRFTFRALDNKEASQPGKVQITVTDQNTAPVAEDFTVRALPNTPTNITLRATDPEANPLNFHVLTKPLHGKVTGKGGTVLYSPNSNYQGSDRFTFLADDGEFDSQPGTVSLIVEGLNHAPVATNRQFVVVKDTPTAVPLPVTDKDGDVLNCPILKGPKNGRVNGVGTNFIYTPKPGFEGTDTFTFKAWDGHTYSSSGTVTLTVISKLPNPDLRFESVQLLNNGQLQLVVRGGGGTGVQVQIYVSTNLVDWTPLGAKHTGREKITIIDPDPAGDRQRYYRASK